MSTAAIITEIRKAFPEQPMPGMTLRQAQLADQSLTKCIGENEYAAEARRDQGVTWTRVTVDTLLECDAALSHLSEEGFVYYIAAYMYLALMHLSNPQREREDAFGSVVFHLTDRSNHSLARFKRLTDEQIDTVIAFLRIVREAGGFDGDLAAKALQRYWETPESRRRTIIHVP